MNWRDKQKLDKLLSVLCDAQFACGKFRFEHENALIDDETYHKLWYPPQMHKLLWNLL